MATETLGGGNAGTTPTWSYVQQVIEDNINKAESAANAAEASLDALAASVKALPFTAIDVTVGTNANPTWSSTVHIPSADNTFEITDTLTTVVCDTIANFNKDVEFTDSGAVLPTMDSRWFSGPPSAAYVTPFSFEKPATTELFYLMEPEGGQGSPDQDLESTIANTAYSLTQDPIRIEHPFGRDWQATQIAQITSSTDRIRLLLDAWVNDPSQQGLPSEYWELLSTEATARIAKQRVGTQRRARNSGAATYWGLPTEAVLVASRAIEQDALEQVQAVETEIVKKRTELVREVYLKGVDMLVAMENRFMDVSFELSKLATSVFQTIWGLRVAQYNANVERFKTLMTHEQLGAEIISKLNQDRIALYEADVKAGGLLTQADDSSAKVFTAKMDGYRVQKETNVQEINAKVNLYTAQADTHAKLEGLRLNKTKIDIDSYLAVVQKVVSFANATAGMMTAQSSLNRSVTDAEQAYINLDTAKNSANLDVARINQAAQEVKAKLDVQQAEYLASQTNTMLQALTTSYVGIYQALLTVSDVNLGSSYSAGDSWSVTASRNAEKVW